MSTPKSRAMLAMVLCVSFFTATETRSFALASILLLSYAKNLQVLPSHCNIKMQTNDDFLQVFDKWRVRAGLNDAQAAKLMGMHQTHLSKIRNHKLDVGKPTWEKLQRIVNSETSTLPWPNEATRNRIENYAAAAGLTLEQFVVECASRHAKAVADAIVSDNNDSIKMRETNSKEPFAGANAATRAVIPPSEQPPTSESEGS
jgi:hypothetical protein